ncbi:MAG: hypothetical protein HQL27_09875 [Candidatus Omnitrophica bacterium]|nr:hypothetical protein [Candidatus Omnitrophota bacterium]
MVVDIHISSPIFLRSLSSYYELTTQQIAKHGKIAVLAKNYVPYYGQMCIGFESPDGWWVMSVRVIRYHFATPSSSTVIKCNQSLNEELTRLFSGGLTEAIVLGEMLYEHNQKQLA